MIAARHRSSCHLGDGYRLEEKSKELIPIRWSSEFMFVIADSSGKWFGYILRQQRTHNNNSMTKLIHHLDVILNIQ